MRQRNRKPDIPPAPPEKAKAAEQNFEALALRARARRAKECEAAIKAALAKFHCRIDVMQVWVNGTPGGIQIQAVALDAPAEGPPG